jgi:hypothetical protein
MAFIPHTKQASRDVRRRLVIVSLGTFCRRGWFPEPGFCVGCPALLGGEGFFDARNGRAQCGEYLCGLSLYIGSEGSESLKITLATWVILPVVWVSTAFYLMVNCLGPSVGFDELIKRAAVRAPERFCPDHSATSPLRSGLEASVAWAMTAARSGRPLVAHHRHARSVLSKWR